MAVAAASTTQQARALREDNAQDIKNNVINTTDKLFDRLMKMAPTDKVARLYAGGDNLWKQFGYEFFKSDLSAALKSVDDVAAYLKLHNHPFARKDLMTGQIKSLDEALDEAAAYMIRNTYPTYSKVPPVVQGIRELPIGNFVSFPAEIIRTTSNNIAMGLKMASHANPKIRAMGIRRMMGAGMTLYGIGK